MLWQVQWNSCQPWRPCTACQALLEGNRYVGKIVFIIMLGQHYKTVRQVIYACPVKLLISSSLHFVVQPRHYLKALLGSLPTFSCGVSGLVASTAHQLKKLRAFICCTCARHAEAQAMLFDVFICFFFVFVIVSCSAQVPYWATTYCSGIPPTQMQHKTYLCQVVKFTLCLI